MIGDPTYADAIINRLVHNAYRIELRGESMRRHIGKKSIEDQTTDEKRNATKELTTLVHDTHTMHSYVTANT
jgi:IstB-like ATP binding protein